MEYKPDKPIWKSYVFHNNKCFFVSTIERDYETFAGISRGQETLVWEYDWDKRERLGIKILYQGGHICDHQAVCRCLINWGEIPDEEDERWKRFRY